MNCSSAEELFERFLEGELAPRERTRVLGHVEGCSHCASLLAELRVIDGLLLLPRRVELNADFTHAIMAQAGALPEPQAYRAPIRAYVVSYLAAAWLIAGTAVWLAPQLTHVVAGSLAEIARSVANAIGGLGGMVARALGRSAVTVSALLAALLALDVMLVVGCGAMLTFLRPQRAERLRS